MVLHVLQSSPPPEQGGEVHHGHLHPRPVHNLKVEGLQRELPPGNPRDDILHAVETLEGGVVRVEGERATQQIVAKGADLPLDAETLLLKRADSLWLRYRTGRSAPSHLLGQDRAQPPVRRGYASVCRAKGRSQLGAIPRFPAEGCLNSLKQRFTWLQALDCIWGPLTGEVGQGAG